jgi:alanine racemase
MAFEAILAEAEQLHNVSNRLEALAKQHPVWSKKSNGLERRGLQPRPVHALEVSESSCAWKL